MMEKEGHFMQFSYLRRLKFLAQTKKGKKFRLPGAQPCLRMSIQLIHKK